MITLKKLSQLSKSILVACFLGAATNQGRSAENQWIYLNGSSCVTMDRAMSLSVTSFTLEAYIHRTGDGSPTTINGISVVPIITKGAGGEGDNSNADMNFFLGLRTSDWKVIADFEDNVNGGNHPITSSTVIQTGLWYHVAATYDRTSKTWWLYIDDNEPETLTLGAAENGTPRSDSLRPAAIGSALSSTGTPAGYFEGYIDEVRIWDVARTHAEVDLGRTREIVSANGLIGRWGFNQAPGMDSSRHVGLDYLLDSTSRGNDGFPLPVNGPAYFTTEPAVAPTLTMNQEPEIINPHADASVGSATLSVTTSDANTDNRMSVQFYGWEAGTGAPDFTIAVLPDTQEYVNSDYSPLPVVAFNDQINWIIANASADHQNIRFVTHVGDVVEHGANAGEWDAASNVLRNLTLAGIPFAMALGNHDVTSPALYNQHFGIYDTQNYFYDHFPLNYGGQFETGNFNNHWEHFNVNGLDVMLIHIINSPTTNVLLWASNLLYLHPLSLGIVVSHTIIYEDGTWYSEGQRIRDLLKDNHNLALLLCGHTCFKRVSQSRNNGGDPQWVLLQDYQDHKDSADNYDGGNGIFRTLRFSPQNNTITSTLWDRTGVTEDPHTVTWTELETTDPPLTYNFSRLAKFDNLASAGTATYTWSNLKPNTQYEWFTQISDGEATVAMSPHGTFTTPALPVVTLAAIANAAEPTTDGLFRVTRTGPTTAPLPVNYTVAGTAVEGTDYQSLTKPVVIPANQSTADILIDVINDSIWECPEQVTLTLAAGTGYTIGTSGGVSITMTDSGDPNLPPSFTKGPDITVLEDCGPQSIAWATSINPGGPSESCQILSFTASNNKSTLFSVQPTISPAGTLTFTPANNQNGSATVTVTLYDNYGGASASQTFNINVLPVNDAPWFQGGHNLVVQQGSCEHCIPEFITAAGPGGGPDEVGQQLTFVVDTSYPNAFEVQPQVVQNPNGHWDLCFTLKADFSGPANVVIFVEDNGGTENGGIFISPEIIFALTVTPASGVAASEVIWQYRTGFEVWTSPVIGVDGTIYVGSRDGYFYAFYPNGCVKWSYPVSVPGAYSFKQSSPAIAPDGTIYIGATDFKLYAINPDGTAKWIVSLAGEAASSPSVGPDGTIYVGSNGGGLRALDPTDGHLLWAYTQCNNIYSGPAIGSDGTIYFGSMDNQLHAVNPDGSRKWVYPTAGSVITSPAIKSDGTIYFGSDDGKVYALNPDGSCKWSYQTGLAVESSPVIAADGTIYVGNTGYPSPKVFALDPANGTPLWSYTVTGSINGSPALGSDGTVYILSGAKLWAFTSAGSLSWTRSYLPATGGASYSSPAISPDGAIYFGANNWYVYAIQGNSGLAHTDWPMFKCNAQHLGRNLGIVSWWRGECSTTDETGRNNAQMEGTVSCDTGEVNDAFVFDEQVEGQEKYLWVPPDNGTLNLAPGAQGFTIETWINPSRTDGRQPLAEWYDTQNEMFGPHFYVLGDFGAGTLFAGLAPGWYVNSPSDVVLAGIWQHVAMVYLKSSSQVVLYCNGVEVGRGPSGPTLNTSTHFFIGTRPGWDGPFYYEGAIDEMTVYNRPLTQYELKAIYDAGALGKCR
jgi:outer membrane protein assembly factor BamB